MMIAPELRRMLRDAEKARSGRSPVSRAWHALADRIDVITAAAKFHMAEYRSAERQSPMMLFDDLRYAVRRVRSKPSSAIACIAMLALAIGVSAAMFTVADHLLLHSAPYRDAARLVSVTVGKTTQLAGNSFKRDLAIALRQSRVFSEVHTIIQDSVAVDGMNGLELKSSARVTPGLFEMLGVAPILGRTFAVGEGRAGDDDRVLISESMWRSMFGSDPGVIGRQVRLSNVPMTIVGVMPASFSFPYWSTKYWRVMDLDAPSLDISKDAVQVYARVAPAASVSDAAAAATQALGAADLLLPEQRVILRGVTDGFMDPYARTAITALSAGVGLVFLVLCANVANLVLARTTSRYVEYSIASAIGASRARIIRQAFVENIVIGAAASVAGLGLGWALVKLAIQMLPSAITERTLNPIAIDLRAVAAASAIGIVATLVAGLPAAWIGTRVNAADALRLSSRSATESRLSRRWTRAMLVAEVALASVLLLGAGLLAGSFASMMSAESGLDTRHVMTAWLSLPSFRFADNSARAAVAERMRDEMAALPGVAQVAVSRGLPPAGGSFSFGEIDTDTGRAVRDTVVFSQRAGPGFFSVYGIKIIAGREFQSGDADDQVIVSSGLAALLWPGDNSIVGRSFHYKDSKTTNHVIGVAREVRSPLRDPTTDTPEFYAPLTLGSSQVMLGIRCTSQCPSEAVIRARIRTVDSGVVAYQVGPLDERYAAQFERPRAAALVALTFALVGLAAAGGGLFSVLTVVVGRRRREFGVRVALGARPSQLKWLIIGDGLATAAIGLVIGGIGAVMLSRWISSLAYGVSLASPLIWIAVIATVLIAAALSSWASRPRSVKGRSV